MMHNAQHGIYHVRIYVWHGKKLVLAREDGGGFNCQNCTFYLVDADYCMDFLFTLFHFAPCCKLFAQFCMSIFAQVRFLT